MPVNSPPPVTFWGDILQADSLIPTGWGNADFLNEKAPPVLPLPDGGAVWMQGGFGGQYWRVFPDGSLHRYLRTPTLSTTSGQSRFGNFVTTKTGGELHEWRIEHRNGVIEYKTPTPFGGTTEGDKAWKLIPDVKPLTVTDKKGVVWYYDDKGGCSFGVNPDGSVDVYQLNLFVEGIIPPLANEGLATHVGHGSQIGQSPNPFINYNSRALPSGPVITDHPLWQGENPVLVPATYFGNLIVSDEKILSLPASSLAATFYTVLKCEMQGNCPHYIPNPLLSAGLSEVQAYCNEMDLRMRIYHLRPDMQTVKDLDGRTLVGLIDPMQLPIYNGMRCKDSIWATVGLSVALAAISFGAGAILPILGTLANLSQLGATVSDAFAAREGLNRLVAVRNEIQGGLTVLLKESAPPVPPVVRVSPTNNLPSNLSNPVPQGGAPVLGLVQGATGTGLALSSPSGAVVSADVSKGDSQNLLYILAGLVLLSQL